MAGEAWNVNAWAPNAWAEGAWDAGTDVPANLTAATAIEIPALPYSTSQDVHSLDTGLTYTVWYQFTTRSTSTITVTWARNATVYVPTLSVLTNGAMSCPVVARSHCAVSLS